jgi:uncharacterized RDD family membrane protein YckC
VKLDAPVHYVGAGRRTVAGLIDASLVLGLVVALVVAALMAGVEIGDQVDAIIAGTGGGVWLWGFAALALAQALLWWLLGGTPGMLLMGCLVLDAKTGRRLSLPKSLLRCLGFWLCLAPLGLGLAWILRDPRHQGLHDKLAGSLVVGEDESLLSMEELSEMVN